MGKRRRPERRPPWWQQIPTWLTAVAAFVTAFAGAWVVFSAPSSPPSTPTTITSTTLPYTNLGKATISSISPKLHRNEASYEVAGEWRPVSSDYDVRVVGRPRDDPSQWVLSDPAQVKPDGSWTATLTVGKTLHGEVVISVVVMSKEGALPRYLPTPARATH
jgi:hypothetical protein